MKTTLPRSLILLFLFVSQYSLGQIPNSDFEHWTWSLFGFQNPDGWDTNNADFTTTEVKGDVGAYHGDSAMLLRNAYTNSAWAMTNFPLTTHPLYLTGYVKCTLADNTDTVSIKINLLYNGLPVDSGAWYGLSTLSNYIEVKIPISHHASSVDSAVIIIAGGNHLTNNQAGMGTDFWVDYLTLDFTEGIETFNGRENDLTIYPNPASNVMTIVSPGKEDLIALKIVNVLGEEVFALQDQNLSNALDVSQFAEGIYFVRVKTDKERVYDKRIIVTR